MSKFRTCIYCLLIIGFAAPAFFLGYQEVQGLEKEAIPTLYLNNKHLPSNNNEEIPKARIVQSKNEHQYRNQNRRQDHVPTNTAQVTFSMTILPVRFVYLDTEGKISKIWNNAESHHEKYAVKFFNLETEEEIEPTEKHLEAYYTIIYNLDTFFEGDIFDATKDTILKNPKKLSVDFTLEPDGFITEIHTLV